MSFLDSRRSDYQLSSVASYRDMAMIADMIHCRKSNYMKRREVVVAEEDSVKS